MLWDGSNASDDAFSFAEVEPPGASLDYVARRLAYPVPAEKEPEAIDAYTSREELILSWTARLGGLISFFSGLYMLAVAWQRRKRNVFHRLMLGAYCVLCIACRQNRLGFFLHAQLPPSYIAAKRSNFTARTRLDDRKVPAGWPMESRAARLSLL